MRNVALCLLVSVAACDSDASEDPIDTGDPISDPETDPETDTTDDADTGPSDDPLTAALSCDRPADAVQMCDRIAVDGICAEYAGAGFDGYNMSAECDGAAAVDWCETAQLVGYCVQVVDADPSTRMLTYFYDNFPNVEAVTAAVCVDQGAVSSAWCPFP